jgi:hypothetical protein
MMNGTLKTPLPMLLRRTNHSDFRALTSRVYEHHRLGKAGSVVWTLIPSILHLGNLNHLL